MKRFSLGTALTLGILSFGSAAFAGQPVGTTGQSATEHLRTQPQQEQRQLFTPQNSLAGQSQVTVSEAKEQQLSGDRSSRACLPRPVTSGGSAQKAFAALAACRNGR
jgi:hypothetical protein